MDEEQQGAEVAVERGGQGVPYTPAGIPSPAGEEDPDPRRVRWLEQGFRSFFAKHDPLRDVDASASAQSTAGREHETYRRLLAEYPRCPVVDLDWLLHPPPSVFRDPLDEPRPRAKEVADLQKEVHSLSLTLLERLSGQSASPKPAPAWGVPSASPAIPSDSPARAGPLLSPVETPPNPQPSPKVSPRGGGTQISPVPPHGDAPGSPSTVGDEQLRLLRRLLHLQQCSMDSGNLASDGERHGEEGHLSVLNEQLRLLRQLADTSPRNASAYVGAPSFAPGAPSYSPSKPVRFISPELTTSPPPPAPVARMRWVTPSTQLVSVPIQTVADYGDLTPKTTPPPPHPSEWMPVSMPPNAPPPHFLSTWNSRSPISPGRAATGSPGKTL